MLARQGLRPAPSSPTSQTRADCFHDESHSDIIASQVAEKILELPQTLFTRRCPWPDYLSGSGFSFSHTLTLNWDLRRKQASSMWRKAPW